MTTYINMRVGFTGVETVDEFDTHREAAAMVKEYRLSDPSHDFYLSQRSTNEWREDYDK